MKVSKFEVVVGRVGYVDVAKSLGYGPQDTDSIEWAIAEGPPGCASDGSPQTIAPQIVRSVI